MRNKKTIIMILCSCLVVIAVFLFNKNMILANVAEKDVSKNTSMDELLKIMELQHDAVMANENIVSNLKRNEHGGVCYPEGFGGAYIIKDKLVIASTNIDDEQKALYLELAGDYSDALTFEKVKYSREELAETAEKIYNQCKAEGYITYYGVSESRNTILFGVENEDSLTKFSEYVKQCEHPIEYEVSARIKSTSATTLKGGDMIHNVQTNKFYSLGVCGGYRSQLSFVTCGHVSQDVGDTIKYNSSTGNTIGTVRYRRCSNGQYGDFEFVTIDSASFSSSANIANAYTVTGTLSDPVENTILHFYGCSTAADSAGLVTVRNINGVPSPGTTIHGITQVIVLQGSVTRGDSGGPVFGLTGNNASFAGVISGSDYTGTDMYMYFTPYTYINSAGFSVNLGVADEK